MRSGFERDSDGVLVWVGGLGSRYSDPGEAIKTMGKGGASLSCTASLSNHWSRAPCGKTPKHDPDLNGNPTRCGVHSAAAVAKRQAASQAATKRFMDKITAETDLSRRKTGLEGALRQIAEGHNDPRGLAREVLDALDQARETLKGLKA